MNVKRTKESDTIQLVKVASYLFGRTEAYCEIYARQHGLSFESLTQELAVMLHPTQGRKQARASQRMSEMSRKAAGVVDKLRSKMAVDHSAPRNRVQRVRKWTPAQRKAQSRRIRAYWADKRRAAA